MRKISKLKQVRAANRGFFASSSPNAVDIGNNQKGFYVLVMSFENGDECEYATTCKSPAELLQKFPEGTELEYDFIKASNPKYLDQLKKPGKPNQTGFKRAGRESESIRAQWAIKQAVAFHNENGFNYNPEDKEKTLKQQAFNEIYRTAEDLLRIHDQLEQNIKANKYQPNKNR